MQPNAKTKHTRATSEPLALSLMGVGVVLVSLAIAYSWYTVHVSTNVMGPLIDDASELRFSVVSAHLMHERILAGEATVDTSDVLAYLDRATSLTLEASRPVAPGLQRQLLGVHHEIDSARALLGQISALTRLRLSRYQAGAVDHSLDSPYDSLLNIFRTRAYAAEGMLQSLVLARFRRFASVQIFLLLTGFAVAASIGLLYHRFDRRRAADMLAVQEAHRELEKACEQLASSEQQLRAANQQLQAQEQQLRASNQQIQANEQQLRASNLHLKQNERMLRLYESAVEHSEEPIVAVNRDHRLLFVNQAYERYLALPRSDILGKALSEVIGAGEASRALAKNIDRALAGERIQCEEVREYPGMGKRSMQVSFFPVSQAGDGETVCVIVKQDITERLRTEEERQTTHKIEMIGQLAGGIAHDFNNLLGGIFGFISLAKLTSPNDSPVREHLDGALSAFSRAKDLTNQLLTFSKGGAPVKKRMDVHGLVRNAVGLSLSGSNVKPLLHIQNDLWAVDIDEGQIHQALGNILLNARQAMPNGGEVVVRAANRELRDGEVPPLSAGMYVELSVRDQGLGIPPDHLSRIFEPFFTTKQKGSGIGLSISLSIVKRHGGLITVDSRLGDGTTIAMFLPAVLGHAEGPASKERRPAAGSGVILVMDDEEAIRKVARKALESGGYHVLVAEDGTHAVDLLGRAQTIGQNVQVAVLDLTIPGGMGGKEAILKLRALDPSLLAIVSSGYSDDPVLADPDAYGFQGVLRKPYQAEDLLEAVAALLSTRGAAPKQ